MRLPFLPPLAPSELGDRKVHELVRDYPEVIPVLETAGVSIQRDGANNTVGRVMAKEDLEGLLAVVAWRGKNPGQQTWG